MFNLSIKVISIFEEVIKNKNFLYNENQNCVWKPIVLQDYIREIKLHIKN